MSESSFGVVGVGNALVDVLSHADEAFVAHACRAHGTEKGFFALIREPEAVKLYDAMPAGIEASGGSSANTMAGFASFGGNGAFIGKVFDDQLGKVFQHDLRAQGIFYGTEPLALGPATGRCLILITPDAQRTMFACTGASEELSPDDIDPDVVASSRITYLEGYSFEAPRSKKAFYRAAEVAHAAGHRIALTLSDPFCVDRHRHDFLELVQNHVDILFANEEEIKSLFMTQSFEDAASAVNGHCSIAVLTRSEKGAVIVSQGQQIAIPAHPIAHVVDTTGAGDQFAAGVLYGLSQDMPLETCGRLGALAASEVIGHIGGRPETPFKTFLNRL
ncbi:MAG TPA: adenosine kinase [Alphaproteobacteria bacterium]|nr:adenosine kinase [Alphaproteobacteria bacterium]